jgi:hypothetical protein
MRRFYSKNWWGGYGNFGIIRDYYSMGSAFLYKSHNLHNSHLQTTSANAGRIAWARGVAKEVGRGRLVAYIVLLQLLTDCFRYW